MAFWHTLKGVLARPFAEWYLDHLAFAMGVASGGASQSTVILWNNSSPPANFYIVRQEITITSAHAGLAFAPIGQTLGTFWANPTSAVVSGPQPPGQVFQSTGVNPDTLMLGNALGGFLPADGQLIYDSNFPMAVIPPNMGWCVTRNDVGNAISVNWWYVWK